MIESLLKRKEKLLKELDKISDQIAVERIQLQESEGHRSGGVGKKSSASFERKARAKFRIT